MPLCFSDVFYLVVILKSKALALIKNLSVNSSSNEWIYYFQESSLPSCQTIAKQMLKNTDYFSFEKPNPKDSLRRIKI